MAGSKATPHSLTGATKMHKRLLANMGTEAPKSDARFRSFAERYLIARAANFRVGHEVEDAWACTMDARTVYAMIKRVGTNIEPEDGSF